MLNLANQILDVYDDTGRESLEKLASVRPDCNVLSTEERSGLKDYDFALTIITKKASKLNKYPICDADSTWLSSRYFDMHGHKLPLEAQKIAASNIKLACSKYKIEPSETIHKLASSEIPTSVYFERDGAVKPVISAVRVDMSKLADVDNIGDNYTAAQYAMPTTSAVKIACSYLEEHHSKMPVDKRHKYAAAIQRRAHELGMGTQKGIVAKYASDHYSPMVDAHIQARASLLEAKPEMKSLVTKIGAAKKQYSPSQFAQILHGFDKQAGLDRHYGSHLQNPFQATFAVQPDPYEGFRYKTASQNVIEGDELTKLVNVKYAKIKEYFGETMADELKRNPTAIFDSLPRDAKEIIVGIADGTH
jgi:hypothetical protein